MVELLHHEVRFGELSWGPFLHYATFFDLLIRATEELSYVLEYPAEGIVAAGGVPFAPVAIHAEFERYPRYPDAIVVSGEPTAVGETNVQVDYRFVRAADGAEFGRARLVHVTITPEGAAEPVAPELRERLESMTGERSQSPDWAPARIEPRSPSGDGAELGRTVTFRTPHLEAAGLGYFEDYARELAICLEEFLEARGRSLGELTGETSPFVPAAWDLTIERSIRFEDAIAIVGRVVSADPDAVEIAYEFRDAATDEVCIRTAITYGCLDEAGDRVPFPAGAIEAMSGDGPADPGG